MGASVLLLGGAELGESLTALARRVGMSPAGGGICRAERRGDGARARVPTLSASGGLPHELFTFLRASPLYLSDSMGLF